jgi:hypothetical protein
MAYNQKKSIIQGTSSHASALKQTVRRPYLRKSLQPYRRGKKKAGWGEGWFGLPDMGVTEFLDKFGKPKNN